MVSYNKFSSISIGGSNTNTIPKTINSVSTYLSLDVSGNANINGFVNIPSGSTFQINGYDIMTNSALLGVPTCPTAASTINSSQIASTAYVTTAISNLLSSAPSTLDTLNELATALNDDPNFSTTITALIGTKSSLTGSNSFSGTNTFDNSVTISTGQLLNLIGSLYVNSTTITPAQLSYLSGLTSNAQTQINSINTNLTNYTAASGTQYFNLGGYAIPTTTTGTNAGFYMGWNKTGGRGETDFLSCGQTSGSGFNFYVANSTNTPTLICSMLYASFTIPSTVAFILSSYLDLTTSSGLKVTSGYTISPTVLSYLDASSSIQTQINTCNTNITSNTSNIASNTSNIATLNTTTATQTSNIATNTSNIATNTSNIASNTSSITTLNTTTATQTANIATNTSNIASNTSSITTLNTTTATQTANIATINSTLTNISYSSGLTTLSGSNLINPSGITFPTTNTGTKTGLSLYYNNTGGTYEVDYLAQSGNSGVAGHYFYVSSSTSAPVSVFYMNNSTITVPASKTFSLLGTLLVNATSISPTVLSYLSGLSSNAQTQLNTLTTNTTTNTSNISSNTTSISNINTILTNIAYSSGLTTYTGLNYFQLSGLTFPTTNTGTKSGLGLYWNGSGGQGETDYVCYGQGGNGGHYFYTANHTVAPVLALSITDSQTTIPSTQTLNLNGNINANSTTITPTQLSYISGVTSAIQSQLNLLTTNLTNLTSNFLSLAYSANTWTAQQTFTQPINTSSSTLPTYATNSIGYSTNIYSNTTTSMTSATYITTSALSLGVGIWSISANVGFFSSSLNSYSTEILLANSMAVLYGSTSILYHYNCPASQNIQHSSGTVTLSVSSSASIQLLFRMVGGTNLYYSSYYLSATKIA